MAYTYENVTPTLIANTTMQKRLLNGVHRTYLITANDGYVLHDKVLDWQNIDGLTEEIIEEGLGYTRATVTCAANYDFTANTREFYAIPENEVPENCIFGGTNKPESEVM